MTLSQPAAANPNDSSTKILETKETNETVTDPLFTVETRRGGTFATPKNEEKKKKEGAREREKERETRENGHWRRQLNWVLLAAATPRVVDVDETRGIHYNLLPKEFKKEMVPPH